MQRFIRFDKFVQWVNILFVFLLVLACIVPYLPSNFLPILSFISLGVPLLVLFNIICICYWMLRKSRFLFLSLVTIFVAYLTFGSFFKFSNSSALPQESDLKIMTFNTRAFNKYQWIDIPDIGDKIMTFVKEQDADILCFQEFNYSRAMEFDQYPYHYVEYIFLEQPRVVQGILSKYPIVQKGSLDFPQSHNNASFADVVYKQDTIRIYNVHLESLRIDPHTDAIINEVSGKLVNRMSKAFSKQEEQANILAEHQQTTTFNKIVCGDFNTTQYSKAYRIIKGPLQDTFTQKGEGFGRTYDLNYFPLRIDFMLVDEAFEITSHNNVDVTLSDHYPVISTLRLREE